MRKLLWVFVGVVGLLLVGVVGAIAQSSLRLLPTVVTVNQTVPTNVTLTGVVNGQALTLTAPVNVTVSMQIKLESTGAVVAGQVAAAQPATQIATQYDARQ